MTMLKLTSKKALKDRMARQHEIMSELIDKGVPTINAIVQAGDLQSAEMANDMVRRGTPPGAALNLVGSYARFDWAVANLPRPQLLRRLPELWIGADPDDTRPEYLALWREAYDANGGNTILDGRPLPIRYGIGDAKRPPVLTVYRGQVGDAVGISWTLDHAIAKKFARTGGGRQLVRGGRILKRIVKRSEVLAYLTGRGESEVIIGIFSRRK